MAATSRIQSARRQLRTAQVAIGAVSAAGLAVFAFAARASHPAATTPASPADATATATATDDQSSSFGFDSGSISPGYGAPSVQSSGS